MIILEQDWAQAQDFGNEWGMATETINHLAEVFAAYRETTVKSMLVAFLDRLSPITEEIETTLEAMNEEVEA